MKKSWSVKGLSTTPAERYSVRNLLNCSGVNMEGAGTIWGLILPEQAAISPQIVPAPSILTPEQFNRFLTEYLSAGVVERPFTDHDFFVASEQLNNIGATTDLGR